MKRALIGTIILSLAVLTGFGASDDKSANNTPANNTPPAQPSTDSGHLQKGGQEIGQGYGEGGKEMGRGVGGFGKNVATAKFGDAGRSLGRGSAEFGKGVGRGTARGFKHFGLAFRNLGRKIDRGVSDDR